MGIRDTSPGCISCRFFFLTYLFVLFLEGILMTLKSECHFLSFPVRFVVSQWPV